MHTPVGDGDCMSVYTAVICGFNVSLLVVKHTKNNDYNAEVLQVSVISRLAHHYMSLAM